MHFPEISFLFATSQPERLSTFYSSLISSNSKQGLTNKHYTLSNGIKSNFSFFRPSSNSFSPLPIDQSVALCFQTQASESPIRTINSTVHELLGYGAKLIDGPRLESFGAEAWLSDIDGNKILILVPFPASNH